MRQALLSLQGHVFALPSNHPLSTRYSYTPRDRGVLCKDVRAEKGVEYIDQITHFAGKKALRPLRD